MTKQLRDRISGVTQSDLAICRETFATFQFLFEFYSQFHTNDTSIAGKGENPMTFKKALSTFAALTIGLVTSSAAFAANYTCVPTAVNSDNGSWITLTCNGANYYAQPGNCGNSLDAVKMYLSIAQAALLSGKSINIATSSASGCTTHFVWMQLNK